MNAPPQPPPPRPAPVPSCPFEAMPAALHQTIAGMLLRKDRGNQRLSLARASRTLLSLHDCKLTSLLLGWNKNCRIDALASLTQRSVGLVKVDAPAPAALPALAHAIGHGCLRQVRDLSVRLAMNAGPTTMAHVQIAVLAQALLVAPRTRLTHLTLLHVGLNDGGFAALAHLVREGRFEQLEEMGIYNGELVTDQGLHAMAEAVQDAGARGLLPMLSKVSLWDLEGVTPAQEHALASALTNHCPRMTRENVKITWS